jgi:hypothetical protein
MHVNQSFSGLAVLEKTFITSNSCPWHDSLYYLLAQDINMHTYKFKHIVQTSAIFPWSSFFFLYTVISTVTEISSSRGVYLKGIF